MAELLKNKNLDINELKINDYFEFNNINNFEMIYITNNNNIMKDKKGVVIGDKKHNNCKNITSDISDFVAINSINQSEVLYIYDDIIIKELNLQEYILKYNKIIVTNNSSILKDLGLFNLNEQIIEKKIDKYGIISNI